MRRSSELYYLTRVKKFCTGLVQSLQYDLKALETELQLCDSGLSCYRIARDLISSRPRLALSI